jgi:hypothetical protein
MKYGNRSFWVIIKEFVKSLKEIKRDINDITNDEKKTPIE